MLGYVFAVLGAGVNAGSSVAQRKANMDLAPKHNMSWRLIVDLFHEPIWFLGVLGIIAGFLLQAAALGTGTLAGVESTLVLELPFTLILAVAVFHRTLDRGEWVAIAAITVGLVGLLSFLSPASGTETAVPAVTWLIGVTLNLTVIGALVIAAHRNTHEPRAAALLGAAAGAGFGLTAALIKAVTNALEAGGVLHVLGAWQTYAMVASGLLALFLVQSALNKGPLVAAQPGFTIGDPAVSILWGVVVFGEHTRGGVFLFLAACAAVILGCGVIGLSRSPTLAPVSASPGGHRPGPT